MRSKGVNAAEHQEIFPRAGVQDRYSSSKILREIPRASVSLLQFWHFICWFPTVRGKLTIRNVVNVYFVPPGNWVTRLQSSSHSVWMTSTRITWRASLCVSAGLTIIGTDG